MRFIADRRLGDLLAIEKRSHVRVGIARDEIVCPAARSNNTERQLGFRSST